MSLLQPLTDVLCIISVAIQKSLEQIICYEPNKQSVIALVRFVNAAHVELMITILIIVNIFHHLLEPYKMFHITLDALE